MESLQPQQLIFFKKHLFHIITIAQRLQYKIWREEDFGEIGRRVLIAFGQTTQLSSISICSLIGDVIVQGTSWQNAPYWRTTDIHLPLTGNGSEHRSPLPMPPCKTSAPVASKKHGAPETLSMVSIAISEDIRRNNLLGFPLLQLLLVKHWRWLFWKAFQTFLGHRSWK